MNTEIDILQNKLDRYIDIAEHQANTTMGSIINEYQGLEDYVADCDKLEFNGVENLMVDIEGEKYTMHDNAVLQAATKMDIPTTYLRNLAKSTNPWKSLLAAHTLNEHFQFMERDRVLLRTVGNQVRGVLSDKYKRFNSLELYTTFLEEARSAGCKIARSQKTDTRGYIEVVKPEIMTIHSENNGTINFVLGVRLRNSDFGNGALDVSIFHLNVVCLNGMTTKKVRREVHLGAKLPDDINISNETMDADTKLRCLIIKDAIKDAFSAHSIEEEMSRVYDATNKVIKMEPEIKKLPKIGVHKNEVAALQNLLMDNDPANGIQGKATMWKMIQGITAVARNVECGDRKRELESIAGNLLYK